MPEGHTIHRLALDHAELLADHVVHASSPQGSAVDVADAIDGRRLARVDAYGKHLLYRFRDVEERVHVHLGLFGRFRTWTTGAPPPRLTTRLRWEVGDATVHLSGATASELLDEARVDALLARIGPDPLRADADPDRVWASLQRRRIPIGAALLDQSIVAGIGNVYRAEILAAVGLDPARPSREVTREEFDAIWATTVVQLTDGVRMRRIVTMPGRTGKPRSRLTRREAVRVYRRTSCGTCSGPVSRETMAARTLFWCPACQR